MFGRIVIMGLRGGRIGERKREVVYRIRLRGVII